MTAHSEISPSMLFRIMGDEPCYASVRMQRDIPDPPSSDAAALGTQLHELAENHLKNGDDSDNEIVQGYLDYVRRIANQSEIHVEIKVSLDQHVAGMFGTADAVIITDDILHVIDLKTGMNPVSPHNNFQLMAYAAGACNHFRLNEYDIYEIHLHIAQPSIGSFSHSVVLFEDIEEFTQDLEEAAKLALEPDSPFGQSQSNCNYCKAAAICPALHEKMISVVGNDFSPIDPEKLTDKQLDLVLQKKRDIEFYLRSVYNYAVERAASGDSIPGWKVIEGSKNRKWTKSADKELFDLLGDEAYEQKLLGITKAEKILGKEVIDKLTYRPRGGPSLVPSHDERPSMLVVDDFDNLEE